MSEQWEFGQEYLDLKSAFRRAQLLGDGALCENLYPRIEELENMMWSTMIAAFPDLAPYDSFVNALMQHSMKLGLSFPDINQIGQRTNDYRFMFAITDGVRTVQIWPIENQKIYSIELFAYDSYSEGLCYQGDVLSLDEAATILSRWFVARVSIDALHEEIPAIPREPLSIPDTRISFE